MNARFDKLSADVAATSHDADHRVFRIIRFVIYKKIVEKTVKNS